MDSLNGTTRTNYTFSSDLYFAFIETNKSSERQDIQEKSIPKDFDLEAHLANVERDYILKALAESDNNLTLAAENLGLYGIK